MKNRKPVIISKKKICIICEGFEEFEYIEKLISLNVWNDKYKFYPINAESNGNIPARYQEKYMSDSYDIVLIFCDTDQKPFEDYETIKHKIDIIHGIDNSAKKISIFANPCTMQIILLHFDDIRLISHKKEKNRPYIKSLTGIGSYSAKKNQRDRLFNQITCVNYSTMIANCAKLSTNDLELSSSNFKEFTNYFTTEKDSWILRINKFLEN